MSGGGVAGWYVAAGWVLLVVCLVAWPLSHRLPERWQGHIIMALSWVALILAAVSILMTATVKTDTENGRGHAAPGRPPVCAGSEVAA